MPDRVGEFRDGVGTRDRLREGARLHAAQLPRRHRAGRRRPRQGRARRSSANLRFAADKLGARGHQAADRADQHVRHSRLLSDRHARRRSTSSTDVGSTNLFLQYDIYHMQMHGGRARARRSQANLAADRAHPARRQSRPQRARHRRDQLSASCSAASTRSATTAGSAANTSRGRRPPTASAGAPR